MGRGLIQGAMMGLGAATEQAGMEQMKAAILAQRDEKLNEYQSKRDDKMMAHTSSENALNRDVTREEAQATREHQTQLQETSLEAAARMAQENREHQSEEAQLTREHTTTEADKSRQLQRDLHKESTDVQKQGLGIQRAQLEITRDNATLEREIKTISLNNAKRVDTLQTEYRTVTDPKRKDAIKEELQVLTGKDNDNYLPVPVKDADGAITGYQVFDKKRGTFVESGAGTGKQPSPGDIDGLRKRASNPDAVQYFESKFGAGAAAKYLGQQPAGAKGAAKPAAPRDANAGLQAQLDFDADSASMSAQDLVKKYGEIGHMLKPDQATKLVAARQGAPVRALPGWAR